MSFNKVIKFFLPKDKTFFPLFEEVAGNLETMAELLLDGVEQTKVDSRLSVFKQILELEHQNDQATHKIFRELANNFITPFDREDIQALAVTLDDIADFINATAKKLTLFEFHEINKDITTMSELIYHAVLEIRSAVNGLKTMHDAGKIKSACIKVNDYENKADDVYESAVAVLFKVETDTKRIMVLKEILEAQEIATDKCENVANIIESILIKYS